MLDAGIIVPSSSAWAFSVLIVSERDCGPIFCVDYCTVNHITVPDRRSPPKTEAIFDDLDGCHVFTTLDLFSSYWLIQVADTFKEMTTFVTKYGHYQFELMPSGLMKAPAIFQRMMDSTLKDIPFANSYLNDAVVFCRTRKDHMQHLKVQFLVISEHKLRLNITKCEIAKEEVYCLAHITGSGEIRINPKKVESIK